MFCEKILLTQECYLLKTVPNSHNQMRKEPNIALFCPKYNTLDLTSKLLSVLKMVKPRVLQALVT